MAIYSNRKKYIHKIYNQSYEPKIMKEKNSNHFEHISPQPYIAFQSLIPVVHLLESSNFGLFSIAPNQHRLHSHPNTNT